MYKILALVCLLSFSVEEVLASNIDSMITRDYRSSFTNNKVKNRRNDRLILQVGLDNMTYKRNDSFKIKWFSPSIGLYFMYDDTIKNSDFSVAIGGGFNFISYNTDFMLKSDTTGIAFVAPGNYSTELATPGVFKGGTYFISYFEIPAELRWRKEIKEGTYFKVAIGVKAGIKLASSYDWNAFDGAANEERNYKVSSFTNASTFRFGPTFRIGYGAFNLYGFYGINKAFKGDTEKDKSDFHQFSIGLSINGL